MAAWSTAWCRYGDEMSGGRMVIVRRSDWAGGRLVTPPSPGSGGRARVVVRGPYHLSRRSLV